MLKLNKKRKLKKFPQSILMSIHKIQYIQKFNQLFKNTFSSLLLKYLIGTECMLLHIFGFIANFMYLHYYFHHKTV